MTRTELSRASVLLGELRRAEEHRNTIVGYLVVGVRIKKPDTVGDAIWLEQGQGGGGRITSIGYPEDLKHAMTAALEAHFQTKIDRIRTELQQMGVSNVETE